ncbi:MAG: hypothetical protein HC796_12400 [Synechococcaceae cyanobacterium RL_1_2]|nr:hypothetical protein [Synechococcaceae cyanobacterium RL_1_2]
MRDGVQGNEIYGGFNRFNDLVKSLANNQIATVASQLGITVDQIKNIMNLDVNAQVQTLSTMGTVATLSHLVSSHL